jgi:hypothetical protein
MKKRTRYNIILGILIAGGLCGVFMMLTLGGLFKALTLKPRLDNLLYHTDHEALLAACRTLVEEGYRGRYNLVWPDKYPDADKLPKEILALKPPYIVVRDDRVKIEMWGGMSHYGVIAYAEDFESEQSLLGNKKLVDGLWFYSDIIDLSKEN